MGTYPTGVTVVAGIDPDGVPVGLAVNSFTSVSLDPPLVLFCPAHSSQSWPRIASTGLFAVNILSAEGGGVCDIFASRVDDKFSTISWQSGAHGLPVLESAVAALECEAVAVHPAGDHDIVVGRVLTVHRSPDAHPLVYYRGSYAAVTIGDRG